MYLSKLLLIWHRFRVQYNFEMLNSCLCEKTRVNLRYNIHYHQDKIHELTLRIFPAE